MPTITTTIREGHRFTEELIPHDLLDTAIEWIKSNLEPENVFDKDQLEE